MRLFLSLIFWCFTLSPAWATWVEAKTDNFIFVGDTSEKKAKVIVSELEEYRSSIFKLFGWEGQNELVPLKVYGVRSEKQMEKVTGNSWASGIYTTTPEGPVFLINIKGGFGKKDAARATAYHEYTHHLISTYEDRILPLWFNEGMAEYLSTFEINNEGVFKLGLPSNSRASTLARYDWMPMSTILNTVKKYPFNPSSSASNISISRFYAQAWLATHYIQSTPAYADKLKAYLKYMNDQADFSNAFTSSFGISVEDFETELKVYYKKNRYPGINVTLTDRILPQAIPTRRLSKAETQFHIGEAIRRFRYNSQGFELADEYYQKATKIGEANAQILASRALVAMAKGDDENANELAKAALALAPNDSRILQVSGHVAIYTFKDTGSKESKETINRARQHLKKAMRANPQNIQAHYDYAVSYTIKYGFPSKQAIASAQEAASYYRGKNFVDSNLALTNVLIDGDKRHDAAHILNRARVWSQEPFNRSLASKELKRIVDEGL